MTAGDNDALRRERKAAFEKWFANPDRDCFPISYSSSSFSAGWDAALAGPVGKRIAALTQERDEALSWVKMLREANAALAGHEWTDTRQIEAEARIAALETENARLKTALKPFCFGDPVMESILYDGMLDDETGTITIKLGDIRRARAALQGGSDA